ncbi:hypothetical protein JCM11641_003445 [Rhodosporidiobolus odoratus]
MSSETPVPLIAGLLQEGLVDPFTLFWDGRRGGYLLEWVEASVTVKVGGGSVKISHQGQEAGLVISQLKLFPGPFPPCPSGSIFLACANNNYQVEIEIALDLDVEPAIDLGRAAERAEYAKQSTAATLSRTPANVLLTFPRTNQQLWANETVISSASPYLKAILSSSFAEGSPSPATPLQLTEVPPYTFEESDDETDEAEMKKQKPEESGKSVTPFQFIPVTDTSYSTYLAVLVWLDSHHIAFAPLLSSFRTSGKSRVEASSARSTAVSKLLKDTHLLPSASSPKSIYRLAHLLELKDLCHLALENLRTQLTPENGAFELYSDVATCYSEFRDVVLEFAVENWDKVKEAKATKEMEEKGAAGDLQAAASGTSMLCRGS